MVSSNTYNLQKELEQFQTEREKIKCIIGSISGTKSAMRDTAITRTFTLLIILLFIVDVLRYGLNFAVHLPPLFSIHIGVLLVSIKIIWMVHKQSRVEHFQFWILNSIEYRCNEMEHQIKKIEENQKKMLNAI